MTPPSFPDLRIPPLPHGDETVGSLLSEQERKMLSRIAVRSAIAARTTIYCEDETAGSAYILEDGVVRMSRITPQGERRIISFMWSGDVFGLSEDGRYVNTAEPITPVTVYRVSLRDLEDVLRADAELSFHLLVKGAHEMRAAQRHLMCLGQHDAARKLARFLLDCRSQGSCFNEADGTLALPMSRVDMADYLGISGETVARALTRMENSGLILRASGRGLKIADASALTAFAEGDGARLPR